MTGWSSRRRSVRRAFAGIVVTVLFCCACVNCRAQAQVEPPWYQSITINGLAAVGWEGNLNRPASRTNQFRVFDLDANAFSLDAMELAIGREPRAAGDAGFRLDIAAGSHLPRIARAQGMNTGDVDLHQVYLGTFLDAAKHWRLDAGKFVTPCGMEVIEGYDGYNDNGTRGLLFGYAIPFTHTGVRATWGVREGLSVMAMVVNGWDNVTDSNDAKTVGAQVAYSPVRNLNLVCTAIRGAEKPMNSGDQRTLIDVVATWGVSASVTLGANVDYGSDERSAADGTAATWRGIAGYARIGVCGSCSVCLRGEVFDDPQGFRTGVVQTLHEFTITPEFKASPHFTIRGDIRMDGSNTPVFSSDAGMVQSQPTVSVQVVSVF